MAEPARVHPPLAEMLLGLDDETLHQLLYDRFDDVLDEFDLLPDEEYGPMINHVLQELHKLIIDGVLDELQELVDKDDRPNSWFNQVPQDQQLSNCLVPEPSRHRGPEGCPCGRWFPA